MATGTVRWFNDAKAYGFIQPHGGGPDVFVHRTGIAGDDARRTLQEGAEVEFETAPGRDGRLQAVNVVIIADPGDDAGKL